MATELRFPVEIDSGDAAKELNALEKEIGNLKKQSESADAKVAKITKSAEKAYAKVQQVERSLNTAESNKSAISEQLENAKDAAVDAYNNVEQLQNALNESKQRAAATYGGSDPRYKAELDTQKQIQAELSKQERILQSKEREAERLEAADRRAADAVEDQKSKLQEARNNAQGIKDELASATERANGFKSQIEEANQQAGELTKKISDSSNGENVKAAISSGFGKLRNGISGAGEMKNGLSGAFQKGLKSALMFGVGIRGTFALVNRMRQYITQAVQKFAKGDAETQGNIDALKSSLSGLKASWGAAFAPVLNAVTPILQRLISMLTAAAQAVTQFMAVLSGRGTFKRAVSSTGQLSDNLGGAAGNAKELNKQMMGIDTLNVAQDSSGGGGGGGGASGSFEDVAVDAESIPAKIAAALRAGEWANAATILTDKLNEMVSSVDWAGIGNSIGGYFDGALNFLADALTTFDWMGLAAGIATFLSNVLESVDWRNLGTLFTAKFRILLLSAIGFLTSFDFGAAASALSQFAVGLLNGITSALQAVDWMQLGVTLWNAIVDIIVNIDWSGIVSALGEVIGAAFLGLGLLLWGFISSAWQEVVDWWQEAVLQDGEFTVQGLLQGLLNGIKNIGLWLWNNIISPLIEGFKIGLGIHSPSTVMAEIGGNIMAGLKQGVINKINSVIQAFGQLKQKITDKLRSLIDTARNINWADIGANIVNGIIDGLNHAWQWLTGAIQQMCSNLLQTAKNILGIHSPSRVFRDQIGENIGAGIEEGLTDSEGGLVTRMRSLSSELVSAAGQLSGASAFSGLSMPMPAVAGGFVAPPNAFSSSGGYGISPELESKIDALLERLTQRPIEVRTTVELDKRKVGESMYTYTEERNRGRGK